MQALSFSVRIPLVCYGISLPVMVLFAELLYLRSGDRLYRTPGAAMVTGVRRRSGTPID